MNEKLRADVELLKSKRVITKDKDIVDATGWKKPIISTYLSGKVKASKNFLDKFYEVYEKDLNDNKVTDDLITEQSQFKALERENRELLRLVSRLQKDLLNSKDEMISLLRQQSVSRKKSLAAAIHPRRRHN